MTIGKGISIVVLQPWARAHLNPCATEPVSMLISIKRLSILIKRKVRRTLRQ
jgi:hypothetical protein